MRKVNPKFYTQREICRIAILALEKPGYATDCGQCKRFVRQILEDVGTGDIIAPPPVLDAAEALHWYEVNHPECIVPVPGVTGDLWFKRATVASPHGHVAIRVPGNKTVENFTSKRGAERGDCRGQRSILQFGHIDVCVRPYRAGEK